MLIFTLGLVTNADSPYAGVPFVEERNNCWTLLSRWAPCLTVQCSLGTRCTSCTSVVLSKLARWPAVPALTANAG